MLHVLKSCSRYALYALIGALGLLMYFGALCQQYGIYFNVSTSLPYGFYLAIPLDQTQNQGDTLAAPLNRPLPNINSTSALNSIATLNASSNLTPSSAPKISSGAMIDTVQVSAPTSALASTLTSDLASATDSNSNLGVSVGPGIDLGKGGGSNADHGSVSSLALDSALVANSDLKSRAPSISLALTALTTPYLNQGFYIGSVPALSPVQSLKIKAALAATSKSSHKFTSTPPTTTPELVLLCLSPHWGNWAKQRQYIGQGRCPRDTAPLGKWIVARAGDSVHFSERGIYVNSKLLPNSQPAKFDGQGRAMPQLNYSTRLKAHQIVVCNPEASSFDSRYYGLLEESQLKARLIPILTWH